MMDAAKNDGPVVGTTAGPRKVLGFGSVLLAPPHYSFGRKLWAPANGLGDALIALLNVAATQERENFSVEHLEHLTALGFYCEVVLPGMDTGVEWEVTK